MVGPEIVVIIGTVALGTAPAPGTIYRGDGHGVIEAQEKEGVCPNVIGVRFEGVSLLHTCPGGIVAGNVFLGSRMNPLGCHHPGGQALMIANPKDAPLKKLFANHIEDFDCIGISLYNHGPVNNVSLIGNVVIPRKGWCEEPLGGYDGTCGPQIQWAMLGPDRQGYFAGIRVTGNWFGSLVRFGHAHWAPFGEAEIQGNWFVGGYSGEFRPLAGSRRCGNFVALESYHLELAMPQKEALRVTDSCLQSTPVRSRAKRQSSRDDR